jgi:hypothetical protein
MGALGGAVQGYQDRKRSQPHPAFQKWLQKVLSGEVSGKEAAINAHMEAGTYGAPPDAQRMPDTGADIQAPVTSQSLGQLPAGADSTVTPGQFSAASGRPMAMPQGDMSISDLISQGPQGLAPGKAASKYPAAQGGRPMVSSARAPRSLSDMSSSDQQDWTPEQVAQVEKFVPLLAAQSKPEGLTFDERKQLKKMQDDAAQARVDTQQKGAGERQAAVAQASSDRLHATLQAQWQMLKAKLMEMKTELETRGGQSISVARILAAQRDLSNIRSVTKDYRTSLGEFARDPAMLKDADALEGQIGSAEEFFNDLVRQHDTASAPGGAKKTTTKQPANPGAQAPNWDALFPPK